MAVVHERSMRVSLIERPRNVHLWPAAQSGRFLDASCENLRLPKGGSHVLHRTKVGQLLVAAAFLAATGCQGAQSAMPALPLSSGAAATAATDTSPAKPKKLTLKLSVKTLAFTAAGASFAKPIVVTETGYTGAFKIASTCGSAVTIAAIKPKGPKATLTVTPVTAISSCTVTVKDTKKHKASAIISVTLPPLSVNPATLSFDATGSTYATTFAITQTGTGAFTETDTCSGIASVASVAWKAPSATATVTPTAAGTCTITIKDAYGQSKTVAVSVTTSGIIIQ